MENNNTCICCGCLIPEGRQICPKCSSEGYCFEQVMSRPVPAQPGFKVDDAVEQAYRRGYAAGLKDNKKLLRETLVNGTDEISICYSGDRIYLDHEILEYARKHYDKKLADLEKAFEEA